MTAGPLLRFRDVRFAYRRSAPAALDGVSVEVGPGRTVLLGPNGAGKSTLIGCAAGVLRPASGSVEVVAGGTSSTSRRALRERVGWMPQEVHVVRGLRVQEQVATAGWLKGLSRTDAWDSAAAALALVQLDDLAVRPAHTLSGGQRARLGLAQALVHDSAVLVLDEPLAALDPDQRERFVALLPVLAERRAVVVSTHDVNDLATSFDHVVVLAGSRVRFTGSAADFLRGAGAAGRPVDAYRSVLSDQGAP